MRATELLRPAADLLEHRAPDRHRALPHGGHVARALAVADAQARHPVARRPPAVGGVDAQLQQPELRVGGEPLGHARERVRRGEPRVVVEEEQQLARDGRDARVAARRDPAVLAPARPRARRPAARPAAQPLPTTATSSSHAALGGERVQRGRQLAPAAGPASAPRSRSSEPVGGEDREQVPDRRDRRRPPPGPTTSVREPSRSPPTASTIAAASASSVASIATNAR